ncbi:hypothetical protein TREMEDRAFT_46186 [Tremella mesenterica DSM 1558]|uniref:uncharacterized protein n=1 Tax=Tremella mesenterica (strain ATCC 24925 / CBS 8224 / DSM 1558 / NBRC 9311 / NRRL Y-6157 / RJB 2259-6 / UBC 559-6) TaxID=578456 RepID=UPI00032CE706|nr:uncharacterized protein TREMEDRAFT_46186 [Tremella mesenterica DSM 1558]EIW65419.1 hypothetical protein TREMEDRAFT_46186 [Tremella mesenterica DSM 1558]
MFPLGRLPVLPRYIILQHVVGSCRSLSSNSIFPSQDKKAYSHTLLLPKTSMPLKVKDPVQHERRYRQRTSQDLYRKQRSRKTAKEFVLHDGPPYANGNLHMGHALNKVLKDMVNRWKVMRGYRVHYVPGWDCHGLPIEMKALERIGRQAANPDLGPNRIRSEARKTALKAIEIQKREQQELGVMADWDSPDGVYRTLDHDFEVRQLRLFQRMVSKGYIAHRLRPTYYSPSTRTALAEAELKYKDGHKSRSVYVAFPVEKSDMSPALTKAYEDAQKQKGPVSLSLAIWTTTAWSLPGNMGVAVNQDMEYSIVRSDTAGLLVVATERLLALQNILGPLESLHSLSGADLVGTRYTHLFHSKTSSLPRPTVFASNHVLPTSGTGLVHSAPAHGYEDYQGMTVAGVLPKELRCPIDDDGRFTAAVTRETDKDDVARLIGQEVLGAGIGTMIDLLRSEGSLLAEEVIEHRYPYDWKTNQPIIVRATPQWFADVESIKDEAVKALEEVHFVPPQSRNRLEAFIVSRSEWCISRQRSWGVPIPALYTETGEPIIDEDTMTHIISVLQEKGTDHWWTGPAEDFIPPGLKGQRVYKGTDTLDVWFDSGSSWSMLQGLKSEEDSTPLADVYLEGSDQHRGWFQSSILTKISADDLNNPRPPYGTLITHGFVLDEEGQKMSKSEGNGISPMEVIHGSKDITLMKQSLPASGTDALRIWAASVEYTRDVSIGPSSIAQASETLRKLRSALRFLLANTAPGDAKSLDQVELSPLDSYVIKELDKVRQTVIDAYDSYAFNKVLQTLTTFTASTLSSLYFDTIKDSLYCNAAADPTRQAVIATLDHVLRQLLKMIAPIVPHLAEEVFEHREKSLGLSVFDDPWLSEVSKYTY